MTLDSFLFISLPLSAVYFALDFVRRYIHALTTQRGCRELVTVATEP